MEGLKILLIFIIMIFLLQRKTNTGIVMILGALLFGLFYLMNPLLILQVAGKTLFTRSTIELMLVLILITSLEITLRDRKSVV